MSRLHFAITIILQLFLISKADIYLHFPPGSNNRVNEITANRANPQNAFDSQNNNKGGYNVPDATSQAFGNNASQQYYYVCFMSWNYSFILLRIHFLLCIIRRNFFKVERTGKRSYDSFGRINMVVEVTKQKTHINKHVT